MEMLSRLCHEVFWHYDCVDYAQWSGTYTPCLKIVLYALYLSSMKNRFYKKKSGDDIGLTRCCVSETAFLSLQVGLQVQEEVLSP